MDDLEIKIAITYKVPKNNLTLNGLLRGLEHNRDEIMRAILGRILEALEEKAKDEYPPGCYVLNGHQSTVRNLVASFGRVRHRTAQVLERTTGAVVFPLIERLKIEPYRQYQRETLEAPVGQAIHLSYRWVMKETRRLRSARMESQRCLWHGHHDFRFLLCADQVKGPSQRESLELLNRNPLFHLRQAELETLKSEDEPLVRKLARTIRSGLAELLRVLPESRYPKTRTYLLNFSRQPLAFFDYWLDHQTNRKPLE
jgi:hypothetical protein